MILSHPVDNILLALLTDASLSVGRYASQNIYFVVQYQNLYIVIMYKCVCFQSGNYLLNVRVFVMTVSVV